jgi:hypothetical protein
MRWKSHAGALPPCSGSVAVPVLMADIVHLFDDIAAVPFADEHGRGG